MKKIVLTYGLLSGAILSGVMLATIPFMHDFGNETGMVIGYTSMVMAFLLVFFGVRSYRDNVGGGRVGFFKALGVGASIGLVASLCYVLTWEIMYFSKPDNDFIEKYQANEIATLRKHGASESEIAAKQKEMDKFAVMYHNPLVNSAMTLMEPLPVALVFSLVTAGIVSRRPKRTLANA